MAWDPLEPLVGFGLTRNQAKIYLTIVSSKADTVKAISKISNIPLESIYRTMPTLEELDLVERVLATPVKYRAMPIKDAIIMLSRKEKKERNNLHQKADILIKNIISNVTLGQPQAQKNDDEITVISSLNAFIRQAGQAVKNAKESFQGITFPEKFRSGMFYNGKHFRESVKRGVECRHIVTYSEEPRSYELGDKDLLENPLWKRKSVSSIPVDFLIIDREELFISTTFHQLGKEHVALRTTSPCLLTVANNYYETLWNAILTVPKQVEKAAL